MSCLNLYRPGRPRLLGAPPALVEGGRFPFASHLPLDPHMEGNPWRLLEEDLGPGVVPAVADANSAQWILHRGLGEEIAIEDAAGRPVRLRLSALLRGSILQSELVIPEAAFERLFPERTGYGFFLVETPDESRVPALIAGLERGLRDFGFDAAPAAARLARFLEIGHGGIALRRNARQLAAHGGQVGLGGFLVPHRRVALGVGVDPGGLRYGLRLDGGLALGLGLLDLRVRHELLGARHLVAGHDGAGVQAVDVVHQQHPAVFLAQQPQLVGRQVVLVVRLRLDAVKDARAVAALRVRRADSDKSGHEIASVVRRYRLGSSAPAATPCRDSRSPSPGWRSGCSRRR